jgi:hypothetical protein
MENFLGCPPHTGVCLAVQRIKRVRNHGRDERLPKPTAAGCLISVNGEEIDSQLPDARVHAIP